ncbi:MAG: FixH family protein [Bacteroidota bacterium]|nr:hypothetical protein [Odoribacter sp.]MDP3644513.1 FixH family protein [Bacteroidota bacterium]
MKIKFNWGTGIVLAMIVMIGGFIFLVSIAVRQDYDLVDKDYYQKSIKYQEHIEKVQKTDALAEKIKFELSEASLRLTFPNLATFQEYSGDIHFYSPVAEKRDMTLKIKLDKNYIQFIDLKNLEKGRYQVKIDWTANQVSYYQEEEISVGN